jgi:ABC-type phosphate transport system substrate-binding protein
MSFRTILAALLAVALCCAPAAAQQGASLRGEPFSDPAATFTMPADWVRRPIRHESWAGKADMVVTLEQDVYQLLLPLIRTYAKEKGIAIAVQEGTCGISAGALSRKAVDIGGYCCPPAREDRLPGLRFHTIGIVAKAIVVNAANPVEALTLRQARDIFGGKVFRWSEVTAPAGKTGPDRPIHVVARFHCPARPGHWRLLLDNEDLFSLRVNEVRTIADMIAQVAAGADAVGWEVPGMLEYYRNLGQVKTVAIDGHQPFDTAALAAGSYPLYRTYNLTTWEGAGVENTHARGLVEYLLREAGRIEARYGFAPAGRLREAGWKFREDELIGERR